MNPHSAADAYRRESIESAPPVKVVQMLYGGVLRYLDRALACDPQAADSTFVDSLARADEIVIELRLALDAEAAPELAGSLQQLYFFAEDQINQGMTERDHEPIRNAREVLHKLQQGWASLEVGPATPGIPGGPA